ERESASGHGRVRADIDDAGHQVPGVGQGVLQRGLSRRALTAIGLAEYAGGQPPRERQRRVGQLQRVDAPDGATCDRYWGPEVRRLGLLQSRPEVGEERLVRVFGTAAFMHVYVDPKARSGVPGVMGLIPS